MRGSRHAVGAVGHVRRPHATAARKRAFRGGRHRGRFDGRAPRRSRRRPCAPEPPLTAYHFADHSLARRLERTEGSSNAAFVESRAQLAPESGATWRDVDGTYAMFDGVGSPLTQTFGLGLFAPATDAHLEVLEAFFAERGSPVMHEVSPFAGVATLARLADRGYRPVEISTVLHRPLDLAELLSARRTTTVVARHVQAGEEALWAETAAQGWGETPELAAFMRTLGLVSAHARRTECWLAEIDGTPVGAAAFALHDGVALLAGASTIPAWRGRGVQAALLAARLRSAAEQGAELAMMVTEPGSASQRNSERVGFRVAYTRTKWGTS